MEIELCAICRTNPSTQIITDATEYPEVYNGKPICNECQDYRTLLRDTK